MTQRPRFSVWEWLWCSALGFNVMCVELDEVVVGLARRHFNFQEVLEEPFLQVNRNLVKERIVLFYNPLNPRAIPPGK